jgi:hypothetical protein
MIAVPCTDVYRSLSSSRLLCLTALRTVPARDAFHEKINVGVMRVNFWLFLNQTCAQSPIAASRTWHLAVRIQRCQKQLFFGLEKVVQTCV